MDAVDTRSSVIIPEIFLSSPAIAPFEYTAPAWGMALDWLLWHTLPDGATLPGAAIIIAAGCF